MVRPISARVSRRSGQNLTSQDVGSAVALAACSLCSTAHVFGTASVKHEEDGDVEHEADDEAPRAEQPVEQDRA